jgi:hypothetical protein
MFNGLYPANSLFSSGVNTANIEGSKYLIGVN